MNNFNPIIGENKIPEFISVISSSKCARIRIEDIEVIEQEGRRLHVITADREYSFYESMKDVIMCLYGRAFYRPVKGLIINFNHVKEISGTTVSFHSGHVVTMGKNSITRTRSSYKKYLMRFPPYTMVDVKPTVMQVAESGLLGPAETMRVLDQRGSSKQDKQYKPDKTESDDSPIPPLLNHADTSADDPQLTLSNHTGDSDNDRKLQLSNHSDASDGEDTLNIKEIKELHIAHVPMRVSYAQAAREASLSYSALKAGSAIRTSSTESAGKPSNTAPST